MTAYEVSICKLAAKDNVDCFDLEEEFESNLNLGEELLTDIV
jgi:hypothetical protein